MLHHVCGAVLSSFFYILCFGQLNFSADDGKTSYRSLHGFVHWKISVETMHSCCNQSTANDTVVIAGTIYNFIFVANWCFQNGSIYQYEMPSRALLYHIAMHVVSAVRVFHFKLYVIVSIRSSNNDRIVIVVI